MPTNKGWTRQQLLIAFSLYCQMPFGKMHFRNPEIVKYSKLIDRTPSALAMKLTNIASLDPAITNTGRKGLKGASTADRSMWEEMTSSWERFAIESSDAIESLLQDNPKEIDLCFENEESIEEISYVGKDKTIETTARVGQRFFRSSILSAYNNQCCITGLTEPRLLVASHIIPWSRDKDNRLNPRNGLALSMLHDKAFDIGLITVEGNMTVRVSQHIEISDDYFNSSITFYDGKKSNCQKSFNLMTNFLNITEKIYLNNG